MQRLTTENIKALNIEASSHCVARCPFCSRNQKARPYGRHNITLEEFRRLPPAMIANLRRITFAGNFGDLASNPEMTDIAAYIKELNPQIMLGGETNGCGRNPSWWQALGSWFQDGGMVFALDGLENTHALHRIGTDFRKIIKNIEAFTVSGGVAHWKFILFEHNKHQIEAAEKMAREIGCARFFVVSSRDYDQTLLKPVGIRFQIKRDIYQTYEHEDLIALCKPQVKRSLYLAADGSVHPCCHAHCMYITEHNQRFQFLVALIDRYYSEINFKTKPLADIIQGPYFEAVFSQSKTNRFCRMKCNRFQLDIRRKLILYDQFLRPIDGLKNAS